MSHRSLNFRQLLRVGVTATLVVGGLSDDVRAQNLPPTLQPDVRLQGVPPVTPQQPSPGFEVRESAPTEAPPGADNIRFVLRDLEIEGATAYPPETLKKFYGDLIGEDVSIARLYQVAQEIERFYRDNGYFLTRVIVPAQTVENGRFQLRVLEGYINSLELEGDIGPVSALVRSYLENVVGERPLKLASLERYLLLANDIPGVFAQGVLQSTPEVGAARLVARLDRKPFDALLVYDNYGTEFTGIWQGAATAAANSFTRFGEQLTVTGLASDMVNGFDNNRNQWVVQGGGSTRLGSSGLFSEALISFGRSKPGFVVKDLKFKTETWLGSFDVGYPLLRSRELNLTARAGFEVINSDTDVFTDQKLARDRIRKLVFSLDGDYRDSWLGFNTANLSLRQGLPIFDATSDDDDYKSRTDGTNQNTILQASASRSQTILSDLDVLGAPANVSLYGSVGSQYASDTVLSNETFELGGGIHYGRGYDQGEVSGDNGVGTTVELRYTQRPDLRILNNVSLLDTYQTFLFYDYGKVWNDSAPDDSLSSWGGGVRASLLEKISLEFQIAKPLTRNSERSSYGKDVQFLFRIVGRI